VGELTASIAHEVNQPITGVVTNAEAALRWLGAEPPNLDKVREVLGQIVKDGMRAGDVIHRIRALIKKAPPRMARVDVNEAVLDVTALTRSEMLRHGVSLQTQLATGLPLIEGDRIQLQQVILNLTLNAIEAMSGVDEGAREMRISTGRAAPNGVLVTVRDFGPGLEPKSVDRLFEAFHTTKPDGLGMGLAICRSIIEAHGGGYGPPRMNLAVPSSSSPSLWNGTRRFPPSTPAQCRWSELAGPRGAKRIRSRGFVG
jgi:C4-dicarboxylate-specific signal transduction histidine kinase